MLNSILNSNLTAVSFLICMFWSLLLGAIVAIVHSKCNYSSKGFVITIALLPAIVQMVIMLVNGNLGTGVAVMGAFSLVRFRSVPGNAKEISSIFLAMAIGLATGTGYITVAIIFVVIVGGANVLYNKTRFGEPNREERNLKITIPESLDYPSVFDDIFKKYTLKSELIRVKTCDMGSLFKLEYRIKLKEKGLEKEFIDEIRCRNGNLEISCGKISLESEEL